MMCKFMLMIKELKIAIYLQGNGCANNMTCINSKCAQLCCFFFLLNKFS